ncbi:CTP synthase (UTP-ammonia lyase), partial [Snodgrassella alvi SCGC AB-598-O02]
MANQPLKKTTIITNPDQDDTRPLTVEEQRARLRQLIIQGICLGMQIALIEYARDVA